MKGWICELPRACGENGDGNIRILLGFIGKGVSTGILNLNTDKPV